MSCLGLRDCTAITIGVTNKDGERKVLGESDLINQILPSHPVEGVRNIFLVAGMCNGF